MTGYISKFANVAAIAAILSCSTPAMAAPVALGQDFAAPTVQSPMPVNGLLCGRGWHWNYIYFKCVRNRHRCPAGKHWISIIRSCVSI